MKKTVVGIALGLSVLPAAAQDRPRAPSAEEVQRQAMSAIDGMVPFMGKLTESMIEAQLTVMARPETAQRVARYVRNLRDALIKEGFTPDEALRIAIAMPLPTAASPVK